jgi:hypothetical protein
LNGCGNEEVGNTPFQTDFSPNTAKNVSSFKIYNQPQSDNLFYFDEQNNPIEKSKFVDSINLLTQDSNQVISIDILESDPGILPKDNGVYIGNYRLEVRREKGYVAGCIKRNGWHLNFDITNFRNNKQLFNLHVMAWWENGPQVGIYNSANKWCAQSRGTFTDLKNLFFKAFVAAGVTGAVAITLANIAASISVVSFAL